MSWDQAVFGELSFPGSEAVARWRSSALDPASELPRIFGALRGPEGTVDEHLGPMSQRMTDWVDVTEDGPKVALRGLMTKDGLAEYGAALVAAARTGRSLGARGELWFVGLGADMVHVLRLDDAGTSLSRAATAPAGDRLNAIVAENARRAAQHRANAGRARSELKKLAVAKTAADAIRILRATPAGDFWEEVRLIDEQLPGLQARFAKGVFEVVLAILDRRRWIGSDVIKQVLITHESPEATAVLVEMLALPLLAPEIVAYLTTHSELAIPALRAVAAWPQTRRGRFTPNADPAPLAVLARRLTEDLTGGGSAAAPDWALPMVLKPGKRAGKTPRWFHPSLYARPCLRDGARLSADAASRLVAALKPSKGADPSDLREQLLPLEPVSLDDCLLELFAVWCATGGQAAERHIAEALRALGGDTARRGLEALATEQTDRGRKARDLLDRGA